MLSFINFIKESNELLAHKNYTKTDLERIWNEMSNFVDGYSFQTYADSIEKNKFTKQAFDNEIEKLTSYFNTCLETKNLLKNLDLSAYSKWVIKNSDFQKKFRNNIATLKGMFDLFNNSKLGLSPKNVYKSISKVLKSSKLYDFMTEDDFYTELSDYGGQVKLRGPVDFYLEFENDKLKRKYFF